MRTGTTVDDLNDLMKSLEWKNNFIRSKANSSDEFDRGVPLQTILDTLFIFVSSLKVAVDSGLFMFDKFEFIY